MGNRVEIAIVGGGIGGALLGYFARKRGYSVVVVERNPRLLEGASGAAGAFLFPKVGLDTPYTRFINDGILEALSFWKEQPVELDLSGVVILPRDQRDLERFRRYRSQIRLRFREEGEGFYFPDGGVVEVESVARWLEQQVPVEQWEVEGLDRWRGGWVLRGGGRQLEAKRVVLAEGGRGRFIPNYIQIYPVWGERIEVETPFSPRWNYHKRVSLSVNRRGRVKIGATHRRGCWECRESWEEGEELLRLAREIAPELEGRIVGIKGGFRGASRDYFPVVGELLNWEEAIKWEPQLLNGHLPRGPLPRLKGLYILNGLGGRGFSNGVVCSRYLLQVIEGGPELPYLSPLRHLIRYCRKIYPKLSSQSKG